MLKLSLIIPVYNEERHIQGCLDAVALQTVMPDEVILVDNNCTDKTVEIAKTYDFVTVIKQEEQGRGHARSAGFDTATSDILGRIDADARIAKNWVEVVKREFDKNSNLAGVTGLGVAPTLPVVRMLKSTIYSRLYFWYVHAGFDTITMWGANMAIRKSWWNKVKDSVILNDKLVHEDQDLSLWIGSLGGKIAQVNRLRISTGAQSYRYLPKYYEYRMLYRRTKQIHISNGNLKNPKMPRVGSLSVLFGRLIASFGGLLLAVLGVLLFPIDYFMLRVLKIPSWLD